MDFYEVLERRRTYRDFSDREVSDEVLKRVIGSAFKAPTNDHLRQLEFVVVRGRENIAKVIAPLPRIWPRLRSLCSRWMSRATRIRWRCLPTHWPQTTGKMLMESGLLIIPFLPSADTSTVEARGTEFA